MIEIEKALLNRLIKDAKLLSTFTELHITEEFFSVDTTKILFRLIFNYYQNYNDALSEPTAIYLLENSKYNSTQKVQAISLFKEICILKDDYDFNFLVDNLFSNHKARIIKDTLVSAVTYMEQNNTDQALEFLKKGLASTENLSRNVNDVGDVRSQVDLIKKEYDISKQNKREYIQLGFPSLDRITGGIQPGECWTLAGWFKSCKSMYLLNMAYNAWASGKDIIYFSAELSKVQIMRRFCALGTDLPYNKIKFGHLDPEEENRYNTFLDELKKRVSSFYVVYEPGCSTSFIQSKIRELKLTGDPKLVIADYIALITPFECGNSRWEKEGNVVLDLKNIAGKERISIITAAQITKEGHRAGSSSAEFIAGSVDVPRHADLVLSLKIKSEEEKRETNYCEIESSITASRDSECITFVCDAYLDRMSIKERFVKNQ